MSGDAESLSPLVDLGVGLIENCSGFLDLTKKHPVVEMAKVCLSVLGLRLDLVKGEFNANPSINVGSVPRFAHEYPFVTWLSCVCTAYAGSILGGFLTGDSILLPFANSSCLFFSTVAFFLVFYSPFDLFARLFLLRPFNLFLAIATEIYRVGALTGGVQAVVGSPLTSSASFPAAILVAMGVVKGAGSSILLPFIRLIRTGDIGCGWSEQCNEILRPSLFLKAAFWASLLVTAFHSNLLPAFVTFPVLHVFLHAFFVLLRLAATLLPDASSLNPFSTAEWIVGAGLWGISCQGLASAAKETEQTTSGGGCGGEAVGNGTTKKKDD